MTSAKSQSHWSRLEQVGGPKKVGGAKVGGGSLWQPVIPGTAVPGQAIGSRER